MEIINEEDIKNIINKAKFNTDKGDVIIFTNGNGWYIDTLIQNLLKSIHIYDNKYKVVVFCTDKDGLERCKRLNYDFFEYVDIPELKVSTITENKDNNTEFYKRLTFVKIVLISYILKLGIIPLYLDPDMALKKESINDLLSYLNEPYEFIASGCVYDANDLNRIDPRKHSFLRQINGHILYININSNIMIAKPSKYTQELFNVKREDVENVVNSDILESDEDYLRPRMNENKTRFICQQTYPPGSDAKKYLDIARIIHANCIIGLDNKIKLLKECDVWYL